MSPDAAARPGAGMKLLAPLRAVDEAAPLIKFGAEELYCGLVPAAWVRQQGEAWLNRRDPKGANLHGLEELARVVAIAGEREVPVFLTLNAHHYGPAELPFILEMATRAADVGVAALIVADVGLMLALREAGVRAKLHVSSLGTCTNGEAAAFFADLGAARVVLPRHLSVREIAAIRAAAPPELELEAFLLNDGCAYEEGRCLTTHQLGPICMTPWRSEVVPMPGAPADLEPRWRANEVSYQRLLWHLNNCGSSNTEKGLPNGPCGLCALPALAAAGVASLKIVGREASPWRKMASVQLARAVLDRVRAGEPAVAVAARAQALRDTPELCASTYMCYYR